MSNIRPEHYKNCSLECWDAMKLVLGTDGFISFCLGNAFKYLWRHEYKNGKEDILKAGIYLDCAHGATSLKCFIYCFLGSNQTVIKFNGFFLCVENLRELRKAPAPIYTPHISIPFL